MYDFSEYEILNSLFPNRRQDEKSRQPITRFSDKGGGEMNFHNILSGSRKGGYIGYENKTSVTPSSNTIILCAEILKWQLTQFDLSFLNALFEYGWKIMVFQGGAVPLVDLKPVTSTFELFQQIAQNMEAESYDEVERYINDQNGDRDKYLIVDDRKLSEILWKLSELLEWDTKPAKLVFSNSSYNKHRPLKESIISQLRHIDPERMTIYLEKRDLVDLQIILKRFPNIKNISIKIKYDPFIGDKKIDLSVLRTIPKSYAIELDVKEYICLCADETKILIKILTSLDNLSGLTISQNVVDMIKSLGDLLPEGLKDLYIDIFSNGEGTIVLRDLLKCPEKLRSLRLDCSTVRKPDFGPIIVFPDGGMPNLEIFDLPYDSLIMNIHGSLNNLRKMRIVPWHKKDLQKITCPLLTKLAIKSRYQAITLDLALFPSLKHLDLDGPIFCVNADQLTRLKRLKLKDQSFSITSLTNLGLHKQLERLQSLHINNSTSKMNDIIKYIEACCPNVTDLHLTFSIFRGNIRRFGNFKYATNIKILSIEDLRHTNADSFDFNLAKYISLQALTLSGMKVKGDLILPKEKSLRSLILRGCRFADIKNLEKCDKLEYIEIIDCSVELLEKLLKILPNLKELKIFKLGCKEKTTQQICFKGNPLIREIDIDCQAVGVILDITGCEQLNKINLQCKYGPVHKNSGNLPRFHTFVFAYNTTDINPESLKSAQAVSYTLLQSYLDSLPKREFIRSPDVQETTDKPHEEAVSLSSSSKSNNRLGAAYKDSKTIELGGENKFFLFNKNGKIRIGHHGIDCYSLSNKEDPAEDSSSILNTIRNIFKKILSLASSSNSPYTKIKYENGTLVLGSSPYHLKKIELDIAPLPTDADFLTRLQHNCPKDVVGCYAEIKPEKGKEIPLPINQATATLESIACNYPGAITVYKTYSENNKNAPQFLRLRINHKPDKPIKLCYFYTMDSSWKNDPTLLPIISEQSLLPHALVLRFEEIFKKYKKLSFMLDTDEKLRVKEKLEKIKSYCGEGEGGFSAEALSQPSGNNLENCIKTLIQQRGACQQRSNTFILLAAFLDVEAFVPLSVTHAWIYLPALQKDGKTTFCGIDLGGADADIEYHSRNLDDFLKTITPEKQRLTKNTSIPLSFSFDETDSLVSQLNILGQDAIYNTFICKECSIRFTSVHPSRSSSGKMPKVLDKIISEIQEQLPLKTKNENMIEWLAGFVNDENLLEHLSKKDAHKTLKLECIRFVILQCFGIPAQLIVKDGKVAVYFPRKKDDHVLWPSFNDIFPNKEQRARQRKYNQLKQQYEEERITTCAGLLNSAGKLKKPLIYLQPGQTALSIDAAIIRYLRGVSGDGSIEHIYIGSPEDMYNFLKTYHIASSGKYTPLNGPLVAFIKNPNAVLVINWTDFSHSERASYHGMFDIPPNPDEKPNLDGNPMDPRLKIINIIGNTADDAFARRLRLSTFQPVDVPAINLKTSIKTTSVPHDHKKISVDLYKSPYPHWVRDLLFGNIQINGQIVSRKNDPLIQAIETAKKGPVTLVIHRSPNDSAFKTLRHRLLIEREILFNGKQISIPENLHIEFKDTPLFSPANNLTIMTDETDETAAQKTTEGKRYWFNLQTAHKFYQQNIINDDNSIIVLPGLLAEYQAEYQVGDIIYISENIPECFWRRLDAAISQKYPNKHFTFQLAPGCEIEAIAKNNTQAVQKIVSPDNIGIHAETLSRVYISNDPDLLARELLKKQQDPANSDILYLNSDDNDTDLIAYSKRDRDTMQSGIYFKHKVRELIKALEAGKNIILCGDNIRPALYQVLLPLLTTQDNTPHIIINGKRREITGQLLLVLPEQTKIPKQQLASNYVHYTQQDYDKRCQDHYGYKIINKFWKNVQQGPDRSSRFLLTMDHHERLQASLKNNSNQQNPIKQQISNEYDGDATNADYAYINALAKISFYQKRKNDRGYIHMAKLKRIIQQYAIKNRDDATKYYWQLLNCFSAEALHRIFGNVENFVNADDPSQAKSMDIVLYNIKDFLDHPYPDHSIQIHKPPDEYIFEQRKSLAGGKKIENRRKKLREFLDSQEHMLILKGFPGLGKTYDVRYVIKDFHDVVYCKSMKEFVKKLKNKTLKYNNNTIIVIEIDEINLCEDGHWDGLKNIFLNTGDTHGSALYQDIQAIKKKVRGIKFIGTRNANSYPGRERQKLLVHANTIPYKLTEDDSYLIEECVKPILASLGLIKTQVDKISEGLLFGLRLINRHYMFHQHAFRDLKHLSSRFNLLYQRKCDRLKQKELSDAQINRVIFKACRHQFTYCLRKSRQPAFLNELARHFGRDHSENKMQKAPVQLGPLTLTNTHRPIIHIIEENLALHEAAVANKPNSHTRLQSHKKGMLLTGISGDGKSSIYKAALRALGYQLATAENADDKTIKKYYITSMGAPNMHETLKKAVANNAPVILDEFNLKQNDKEQKENERLFSEYLTDPDSCPFLLLSQNPDRAGKYQERGPISEALKDRLQVIEEYPRYTEADLIAILRTRGIEYPGQTLEAIKQFRAEHPDYPSNNRRFFENLPKASSSAPAYSPRFIKH